MRKYFFCTAAVILLTVIGIWGIDAGRVLNFMDDAAVNENGQSHEELDTHTGRLKMKRPDGSWLTLVKIEDIAMTEPYAMPDNVNEGNVGKRIQEWIAYEEY
jgi:hypothetical protein